MPSSGSTIQTSPSRSMPCGESSSPRIREPGSAESRSAVMSSSAFRSTSVTKSWWPFVAQRDRSGRPHRQQIGRRPAPRRGRRCARGARRPVAVLPLFRRAGSLPSMARVFSGIQPSGELHIGNWLGTDPQLRWCCRTSTNASTAWSISTPSPASTTRRRSPSGPTRWRSACWRLASIPPGRHCSCRATFRPTRRCPGC